MQIAIKDKQAALYLSGYVGDYYGGITEKGVRQRLPIGQKYDKIDIYLRTFGGSPGEAANTMNYLRSLSDAIEVTLVGDTFSAGTIFAAMTERPGDYVRMISTAQFMIHEAQGGAWGKAKDIKAFGDFVENYNQIAAEMYAKKTGKGVEQIRELMDIDNFMTAQQAKELGFIDEVVDEYKLPEGIKEANGDANYSDYYASAFQGVQQMSAQTVQMFSNPKSKPMFTNVIQALKKVFGLDISADATEAAVVQAIEGFDVQALVKQQVGDIAAEMTKTAMQKTQEFEAQMSGKLAELQADFEAKMAAQVADFEAKMSKQKEVADAEIAKLKADLQSAEGVIAEMKGKTQQTNSKAPEVKTTKSAITKLEFNL